MARSKPVSVKRQLYDELLNGVEHLKTTRVSEEKMLNDMFVLLEYSDNFQQFVEGMSEAARLQLFTEIKRYYGD